MKEIKHQLSGGKVILPISFEELEGITRKLDAYWVVCKKIEHLGNIFEKNDLDQMYFFNSLDLSGARLSRVHLHSMQIDNHISSF
ncbi:hypothetical protein ACFTAO_02685 [Paenibacillus rhizoplanae]